MRRPLALLACLTTVGVVGCAGPPASPPNQTELAYLVDVPPSAAVDSVAAWAAESDFLRVEPFAKGLVMADRRGGAENSAVVDVRARADGLTEVTVFSEYVVTPGFRDLGVALYFGWSGDRRAYALPRPESPTCLTVDDWRAEAETAGEEVPPELVGGLRGVQERLVVPASARLAGAEGVVLVEFVVEASGAVECAQVLSSPHPDLSAAARAAILGSEFTPGTRDGAPAAFRFAVPLTVAVR